MVKTTKKKKSQKPAKKSTRKSFYDYSDYGQLQEALDFSQDEDEISNPDNNEDDD